MMKVHMNVMSVLEDIFSDKPLLPHLCSTS
jgi:hypothetical protein